MINRLLTGWTFQRLFYLVAGGVIVAISLSDRQWVGAAMGTYFLAMGLFAFGCAAGQCSGNSCHSGSVEETEKK